MELKLVWKLLQGTGAGGELRGGLDLCYQEVVGLNVVHFDRSDSQPQCSFARSGMHLSGHFAKMSAIIVSDLAQFKQFHH